MYVYGGQMEIFLVMLHTFINKLLLVIKQFANRPLRLLGYAHYPKSIQLWRFMRQ